MTFGRVIFVFALLCFALGAILARMILGQIFGPPVPTPEVASKVHATATTHPTSTPRPTATPTATRPPRPTATATNTPAPIPTATTAPRLVATPRPTRTPRPTATATPRPTATARPTPTPQTGVITLTNYWVASRTAYDGQTIAIGYVIDNGTGHTARVTLGASLKFHRIGSWLTGQINDPLHDVVAIVPPGVSDHARYFTLPRGLRPGTYDVAWGLRNARTGQAVALVSAADALHVYR